MRQTEQGEKIVVIDLVDIAEYALQYFGGMRGDHRRQNNPDLFYIAELFVGYLDAMNGVEVRLRVDKRSLALVTQDQILPRKLVQRLPRRDAADVEHFTQHLFRGEFVVFVCGILYEQLVQIIFQFDVKIILLSFFVVHAAFLFVFVLL